MSFSNYQIYSTTSEAWDAMYEAIKNAKSSIYWEIYILADDQAGNRFFELLEEKARQGVTVKLIVDYWGSFGLSRKKLNALRSQGIDIRLFEDSKRRTLIWWGIFSSRTHRKILIIDGTIGFVGGVNVEQSMHDWLDIHLRVKGKVVRSLLRSFAKSYVRCGGDKLEVKHLLTYKYRAEQSEVDFIYDHPSRSHSHARQKYAEALLKARERVILFSPYYFPDKYFLHALWQAKKNGIRVDLLIPFRTDLRLATYATYAWFAIMQKRYGVRVHLLNRMMHGKGVIMDDDWAMVGSSNIDQASFYHGHETNIQVKNKELVGKLKAILTSWLGEAESLEQKKWGSRGYWQKIKEWLALKMYKMWFGIK